LEIGFKNSQNTKKTKAVNICLISKADTIPSAKVVKLLSTVPNRTKQPGGKA
jgi:hypothetical protein